MVSLIISLFNSCICLFLTTASLATPVTRKRKFHFDFDGPSPAASSANADTSPATSIIAITSPVTPTPIRIPAQNQTAELAGPGPSTISNKRRRGGDRAAQAASIPSSPLTPPPSSV